MTSRDGILKAIDTVPALPPAVVRLWRLLRDDRASAEGFERVVRPDPTLTTHLLRIVNSAYLGPGRRIETIRQAIAWMGTRRLCEAVTAVSFSRVLPPRIPGYDVVAEEFWCHSVAVAILGERLAAAGGIAVPDLTFTAGLLHDLGKLVIGSFLEEASEEVLERLRGTQQVLDIVETEVLGANHAEVGGALAERWELPEPVIGAVRWHHAPAHAPERFNRALIGLVHVADGLAHSFGFGADVAELARSADEDVARSLGLDGRKLEGVAGEALEEVLDMTEALLGTAARQG